MLLDRLVVEIDPELKQRLKVYAVQNNLSMRDIVEPMVRNYFKFKDQKKGKSNEREKARG